MLKRHWKSALFWALAVYVVWGIGTSESLHSCIHDHKNDKAYRALHESPSVITSTVVRLNLLRDCVGDFAHENDFATFTIALFTLALWQSTNKLWRVSRKALETVERAFVFIDGLTPELAIYTDAEYTPEELAEFSKLHNPALWITRFAAQPRWKNGGNTPTKNMTIQVDWKSTDGTLPVDFSYDYRNSSTPFFLAPKAIEPSGVIEMPGAQAIVNDGFPPVGHDPMMFIWGRADYEDIFGHSHFTQWCYQVRFERHDGKRLQAHFMQWGDYNRTDEDRNA